MSPRSAFAPILALLLASPAVAQPPRAPAQPAVPPAASPDSDRLVLPRAPQADPRRWSLADLENGMVGIGLFSVGGHFARDRERQGREPLSGTGGRQSRVAAVGLSVRF